MTVTGSCWASAEMTSTRARPSLGSSDRHVSAIRGSSAATAAGVSGLSSSCRRGSCSMGSENSSQSPMGACGIGECARNGIEARDIPTAPRALPYRRMAPDTVIKRVWIEIVGLASRSEQREGALVTDPITLLHCQRLLGHVISLSVVAGGLATRQRQDAVRDPQGRSPRHEGSTSAPWGDGSPPPRRRDRPVLRR
jgi:hypothetical protein